jgi:hypothetical protein
VTDSLTGKSALVRLAVSPDAADWAGRIGRGLARAVPAGHRIDPGALEDLPYRGRRYRDAEPCELAVDPPVAPGFVLPGQPYHRPQAAGAATARHAPTGGG